MYRFLSSDDIIQYASGIDVDNFLLLYEHVNEEDIFAFWNKSITKEAIAAVRSIPNLRKVLLAGIGETLSADFITALNHNHKIEALEIMSDCNIGLSGFSALGRIISDKHSVLKELRITHGSCYDDVIQCLYYDLTRSTSLKILGLEGNNKVDEGDKPITSRGFQMLHDVLASPHSNLIELDLSDCDISRAENTELFSGLANDSRLQNLVLSRNKISPTNAMKLSTGLKSNVLLHLDLSGCSITDDGAKALSSGLASNTSLKTLWMGRVTVTWSKILFSLRISSMPLGSLCLSGNNISDETFDDVIKLLIAKRETIVDFYVGGVRITHSGWKTLVGAFQTHVMPKLEDVSAGNEHFDDDVAIALADALKDQPSFTCLGLRNVINLTNIGREVIRKLNKWPEMSHCAM